MRIMIVDDNQAVRSMVRKMLSGLAQHVFECSDGKQALDTYARVRPDWVLMDIKMKEVDGFRATEEILSKFPDARIMMVTQYDEPSLRARAEDVGACEFVLKERLFDITRIIAAHEE
jgi:CheY-like chemotaxis protein